MATAPTVGTVTSVSSRRDTQREYETVIILRPEIAKPRILELVARFQKVFDQFGARLLKIDNWGMRILAFPIKRSRKGIYLYWRYIGGSDIVNEFERNLRNLDEILRFYTVRIAEDVDPSAKPSEITEDLLERIADPGPDPDELRQRAEEAARAAAEAAAERRALEQAERGYDDVDDENDDDEESEED